MLLLRWYLSSFRFVSIETVSLKKRKEEGRKVRKRGHYYILWHFLLTFSETVAPPNSFRIPFTNPTQKLSHLASSDPQEPGGTGYDSTYIYPGHRGVYPWRISHGILIPKGGPTHSSHSFQLQHDNMTGLSSPQNMISISINRHLGYCV